jgi:hypothetical protein
VHHNLEAYSPANVKESTSTLWNAKLLLYCSKVALHYPDEAVIYFELHNANFVFGRFIGSISYLLLDLPGNLLSHSEPSNAFLARLTRASNFLPKLSIEKRA